MSWFTRLTRQQAGQPIQARTINRGLDTAEWASKIKASPPLSISATGAGPLIRYMGPIFGVYVVVTSGTTSARMGSALGTGTGIIQTWDGTNLANLQSAGSVNVTIPIYSISSTTGGIPAGTYGITLKIFGVYFLITLDCGN